jgi:hypothetical protein
VELISADFVFNLIKTYSSLISSPHLRSISGSITFPKATYLTNKVIQWSRTKRQTISPSGAINPFALAEAVFGRKIDQTLSQSATMLSDTLQTDYDEILT